ncbi:MAG: flagellar hook-basal body complex protein FliE [Hyphomicrobiaceae bacterium]
MMTEITAVKSAVSFSGDVASSKLGGVAEAKASGQVDFASMVAQMAGQAVDTVRVAEAASTAGIKGQMPITEVVDKVLEAERSLNAAISVRDKVVAAYLELSRMQI